MQVVLSPLCSDLSNVPDLQTIILSTFSSQTEEVRAAASYALGTDGSNGVRGVK